MKRIAIVTATTIQAIRATRKANDVASTERDTITAMTTKVSAKEQMIHLIQAQPEDSSNDELLRELAFVRRSIEDLRTQTRVGRAIMPR